MPKPLQAPLSLNEKLAERHYARDKSGAIVQDGTISGIADGLRAARALAEQIVAAHAAIMADPTKPIAARQIAAGEVVKKLAAQAAAKLDRARKATDEELARIRDATWAPPPPSDPVGIQLDAEIRARLAAMPDHDKRGEAIVHAIETDDVAVVRAMLSGPAWLCGLTDTARAMRRHAWRSKRFPAEIDREERIGQAARALDVGGRALLAFVGEILNTDTVAKAAAKRAEDAIAAANPPAAPAA